MQIVIDIPEEVKQTFDNAKNEDLYGNYYDYNSLIGKAIRNGTPLPKGHGRLIDADALINYLNRDFLTFERELCYDVEPANVLAETFDIIKDTPTIIEADKAESEE